MSLIELQLRSEIKKLKAGWQEREQELLTVNPQSQLFIDLETEKNELKTKLNTSLKTLKDSENISADLADENQQKDQVIKEWEQRIKDLETSNNQRLQSKDQELRKNTQLSLTEKRQLRQQIKQEKDKIKQLLTDYQLQTSQLDREINNKNELIGALNASEERNRQQTQQLQDWQTQQAEKEQQGERALTEIIKAISKNKAFILGDWKKKKIKNKFDNLKAIFHWDQVDTDISEGETN